MALLGAYPGPARRGGPTGLPMDSHGGFPPQAPIDAQAGFHQAPVPNHLGGGIGIPQNPVDQSAPSLANYLAAAAAMHGQLNPMPTGAASLRKPRPNPSQLEPNMALRANAFPAQAEAYSQMRAISPELLRAAAY